jgi:hypothetical protein
LIYKFSLYILDSLLLDTQFTNIPPKGKYLSGKMISVETIPEMWGVEDDGKWQRG